MDSPFEVYEYSIDKLKEIIAEQSNNSPEMMSTRSHINYFRGYCDYITVKTMVVENNYVDHDYLDDFAGYYVRCFKPYQRLCARLHFFSTAFGYQDFHDFLAGFEKGLTCQTLQGHYLGFVVIKPLPQTAIGRTCLKTYPQEERRHFPITRPYQANLFGVELEVESLAFQEQDSVVAACATSALWSVFQGTGLLFHHPIPSPVEITKAAAERLPVQTRILPNHGLSIEMMAHAIQHVGLEPFLVDVTDEYVLKSTLYAYLRGSVPMILGIDLFDVANNSSLGLHAIAGTGYSLGHETAKEYGTTNFLLTASRIDKIYVHDDQVGPFARMEFEKDCLSSSWTGSDGRIGTVKALPQILLIPLYHKIRIPFAVAHDAVVSFDAFIETLREIPDAIPLSDRLEWDIYLTTVNELKKNIRCLCGTRSDYYRQVLLEPMPRFMWRATAMVQGTAVLDLLFDGTDIEQGAFFVRAIEHDCGLGGVLRTVCRVPEIEQSYWMGPEAKIVSKIIEWFKNQHEWID